MSDVLCDSCVLSFLQWTRINNSLNCTYMNQNVAGFYIIWIIKIYQLEIDIVVIVYQFLVLYIANEHGCEALIMIMHKANI